MSAYLLGVAVGFTTAWVLRSILARLANQRIRANIARLRAQQRDLVAEITELRDLLAWDEEMSS